MNTRATLVASLVSIALLAGRGSLLAQGTGAGKVDLSFIQSNSITMRPNAAVVAIGVQTNGQVLIGGGFTQPNNRSGLARLNADGTVDMAFSAQVKRYNIFGSPSLGGSVANILPRSDGGFFIHGTFQTIDSLGGYTNLALLDATGTHVPSFAPSGFPPGANIGVAGVTVENKILLCVHSNLVYRLSHTGGVETSNLLAGVQSVQSIAGMPDGGFVVAGTLANQFPLQSALLRFDSNGVPDATFNTNAPLFEWTSGTPASGLTIPFVEPGGKILVLGYYTLVGGVQRGGLCRLNSNGTLDTSFVPGANGIGTIYQGNLIGLNGIARLPDGRMIIYRDGPFRYNNVYRNGIARISSTGTLDTTFDPATGPQAYNFGFIGSTAGWGMQSVAAAADGSVYAGGYFTNFNNTSRQFIARLNAGPASSKPTIDVPPASQSVTNGVDVTFTVVASGPGTFSYVWRQNGKIIPGATTASLTITNVDLSDVGVYTVTVANSAGSTTALPALLTVNGVSVLDTKLPTFKITSPAGLFVQVSSNQFDFKGTATDNQGLGVLAYKQDTNAWTQIGLTTNWAFTVNLNPGSNVFLVTVGDTSGNYAPTQRVVAFYAVTQALSLTINGSGTVTGATNNQGLPVGRTFALKATPAAGNLFSNWIADSVISTASSLAYFMKTNATIVCNFTTNPFIALQGTYNGLFYDTNNPAHESSGSFNFKLTSAGVYSLKLVHKGVSYSASGSFDLELQSQKIIARKTPLGPLTVDLQLVRGTDQVTGNVTDGNWNSELFGYRATFVATSPATNYSGKYTMLISGSDDASEAPLGQGFSTVAITPVGAVTFKGVLGENSAFAPKSVLAQNGQCPVYLPLYKNLGSIFGWLTFSDTPTNDIHGPFLWTKPSGIVGALYSGGFTGNVVSLGSRYVAPVAGTRALAVTNGHVINTGGNLTDTVTNTFTLDAANKITVTSTNLPKLTLKLTTSSGLLAGGFTHPLTLKATAIKGVILQKQNGGGGFFPGTNVTGSVYLGDPASTPFFEE